MVARNVETVAGNLLTVAGIVVMAEGDGGGVMGRKRRARHAVAIIACLCAVSGAEAATQGRTAITCFFDENYCVIKGK